MLTTENLVTRNTGVFYKTWIIANLICYNSYWTAIVSTNFIFSNFNGTQSSL